VSADVAVGVAAIGCVENGSTAAGGKNGTTGGSWTAVLGAARVAAMLGSIGGAGKDGNVGGGVGVGLAILGGTGGAGKDGNVGTGVGGVGARVMVMVGATAGGGRGGGKDGTAGGGSGGCCCCCTSAGVDRVGFAAAAGGTKDGRDGNWGIILDVVARGKDGGGAAVVVWGRCS
jgi:hypothetical protein